LIAVVGIGGVAALLAVLVFNHPDPKVNTAPATAATSFTECVKEVLNNNKTTKQYNEGGLATEMEKAFKSTLDAKSERVIQEVRTNDPALLSKLADGCKQTSLAQNYGATPARLVSTKIVVERSTGSKSRVPGATITLALPGSSSYETDHNGEATLHRVAVPLTQVSLRLGARLGNRYRGELTAELDEIDESSTVIALTEARTLSVSLTDLPSTQVASRAQVQLVARFVSTDAWLEAAECAYERPACDTAQADDTGRADFLYDGAIEQIRVFVTYAGVQRELKPNHVGTMIRVSWKQPVVGDQPPPPNSKECDHYRRTLQQNYRNAQYTVVTADAGTTSCNPPCSFTLPNPPARCSDSFAIGRQ
jgi:hypothetical protein